MSYKILFVCTGNICRSPMAEALACHKIRQAGLEEVILVDSAGTHAYHVGERPDRRTVQICDLKGISTDGQVARRINCDDFEKFDLILGMDKSHIRHLRPGKGENNCEDKGTAIQKAEIGLIMESAGLGEIDVPDPYYGGIDGFHQIYEMLDQALDHLLPKIYAVNSIR